MQHLVQRDMSILALPSVKQLVKHLQACRGCLITESMHAGLQLLLKPSRTSQAPQNPQHPTKQRPKPP